MAKKWSKNGFFSQSAFSGVFALFVIFDFKYRFDSENYHPKGWGPMVSKLKNFDVWWLWNGSYHPEGWGPMTSKLKIFDVWLLLNGSFHPKGLGTRPQNSKFLAYHGLGVKKPNNRQVHFYFFPHMKRQLNPIITIDTCLADGVINKIATSR